MRVGRPSRSTKCFGRDLNPGVVVVVVVVRTHNLSSCESLLLMWVVLIRRRHLLDRMPTKAEEDSFPLRDYTLSDSYPLTWLG